MSERTLGLDVSSKCVGWAVFDDATLVKCGKYRVLGASHDQRLSQFEYWLGEMLLTWAPDQLVYEQPFLAPRRRNAFQVLMLYVAAVLIAHYRWAGVELPAENRVAAAEVKRRIRFPKTTSYDNRKQLMVRRVNQAFGLKLRYKEGDTTKRVSDDDTADAVAVVWAWALAQRPDLGFPVPKSAPSDRAPRRTSKRRLARKAGKARPEAA